MPADVINMLHKRRHLCVQESTNGIVGLIVIIDILFREFCAELLYSSNESGLDAVILVESPNSFTNKFKIHSLFILRI